MLISQVLCDAKEYDELPVRHNEDLMNKDLSKDCPIDLSDRLMDSPSTKAHLLLQSHFGHLQLPCSDYYTDTKSVLDQAIRILQVPTQALLIFLALLNFREKTVTSNRVPRTSKTGTTKALP